MVIASDSPFFDKYLAPFIRLFKQKKWKTSGFLERYNTYIEAINHHNLKSAREQAKFIEKHGFFIQEIRLHLMFGKRKLAILYELLPQKLAEKFLSTMYVIMARK